MANISIVALKPLVSKDGSTFEGAPIELLRLLSKNSYDDHGVIDEDTGVVEVTGRWNYSNMLNGDEMDKVYDYLSDHHYQKLNMAYTEYEEGAEFIARGVIEYSNNRSFIVDQYVVWDVESFSTVAAYNHPIHSGAADHMTEEELDVEIDNYWDSVVNKLDDLLNLPMEDVRKEHRETGIYTIETRKLTRYLNN